MRPISSSALILLAVVAVAAGAQTSAPTLEERMPQADFHASGLDKLSPQELAHLDAWLGAHGGSATRYVTATGAPLFYPKDSDRETVEAHITGAFNGWRGQTIFRLDNGQQWQQAESGMYDAGRFTDPKVKIKPMLLGSWLMYVEGCGCSVRVQRIK